MSDRVVVLHGDDGVGFLADACAALADAVMPVRLVRTTDGSLVRGSYAEMVEVYAELVVAYSCVVRRRLEGDPAATVRLNVLGHLEERVGQASAGEINLPVVDLVDRLHGELTSEPVEV